MEETDNRSQCEGSAEHECDAQIADHQLRAPEDATTLAKTTAVGIDVSPQPKPTHDGHGNRGAEDPGQDSDGREDAEPERVVGHDDTNGMSDPRDGAASTPFESFCSASGAHAWTAQKGAH